VLSSDRSRRDEATDRLGRPRMAGAAVVGGAAVSSNVPVLRASRGGYAAPFVVAYSCTARGSARRSAWGPSVARASTCTDASSASRSAWWRRIRLRTSGRLRLRLTSSFSTGARSRTRTAGGRVEKPQRREARDGNRAMARGAVRPGSRRPADGTEGRGGDQDVLLLVLLNRDRARPNRLP
jgi:hypothetical protein